MIDRAETEAEPLQTSDDGRPPRSDVAGSVFDRGGSPVDLFSLLPADLEPKDLSVIREVINANRHLEPTHVNLVVRYSQTRIVRDELYAAWRVATPEQQLQVHKALMATETTLGRMENSLCISGPSRKWNLSANKRGPRADVAEAVGEPRVNPTVRGRGRVKGSTNKPRPTLRLA